MKKILLITFVCLASTIKAQNLLDSIFNLKQIPISSKINYLHLNSNNSDIKLFFFIDFSPNITKNFPEEINFIVENKKYKALLPNLLYFQIDADTTNIDQKIVLAHKQIFSLNFENSDLTKYIQKTKNNIQNADLWDKTKYIASNLAFANNNFIAQSKIYNIELLNSANITFVYNSIIANSQITILSISSQKNDTILSLIRQNFSQFQKSDKNIDTIKRYRLVNDKVINFVTDPSLQSMNIIYKNDAFVKDSNLFAKIILRYYINSQLNELCNNQKTAFKSFIYDNPEFNFLNFTFDLTSINLFEILFQFNDIITNIQKYGLSDNELQKSKNFLSQKIEEQQNQIEYIALAAFFTHKYKLPPNFYRYYVHNLRNTTIASVNSIAQRISWNDFHITIISPYFRSICELFELARLFKIDFYDKSFNKFRIIPFGFDAQYIINDYIDRTRIHKPLENLTIKFKSYYTIDTGYTLIGTIKKKETKKLYYYKTLTAVGKDTLFHQLLLSNNRFSIDSNSVQCRFFESKNDFLSYLQTISIFPELYYKDLKYNLNLLCDTNLLKENIYKIRVSTPSGISFIDYYNVNTKLKTRTEIIVQKGIVVDTLAIYEYFDFKNISKASDVRYPFKIVQYFPKYAVTTEIIDIDDRTKLKNKDFSIKLRSKIPKND